MSQFWGRLFEEEDGESTYYKFPGVTLAVYLHTSRVLLHIETLLEQVMCLKRLVTAAFESLDLIRGIPTYRVGRLCIELVHSQTVPMEITIS